MLFGCTLQLGDQTYGAAATFQIILKDVETGERIDADGASLVAPVGLDLTIEISDGVVQVIGVTEGMNVIVEVEANGYVSGTINDFVDADDSGFYVVVFQMVSTDSLITGDPSLGTNSFVFEVADPNEKKLLGGTLRLEFVNDFSGNIFPADLPENMRVFSVDLNTTSRRFEVPNDADLFPMFPGQYDVYLVNGIDGGGTNTATSGYPLKPLVYLGLFDLSTGQGEFIYDTVGTGDYPTTDSTMMSLTSVTELSLDNNGFCLNDVITYAGGYSVTYTFETPVLMNYFNQGNVPTFTVTGGCLAGDGWDLTNPTVNITPTTIETVPSNTITIDYDFQAQGTLNCNVRISANFLAYHPYALGTSFTPVNFIVDLDETFGDPDGCNGRADDWNLSD